MTDDEIEQCKRLHEQGIAFIEISEIMGYAASWVQVKVTPGAEQKNRERKRAYYLANRDRPEFRRRETERRKLWRERKKAEKLKQAGNL